MMPTYQQVEDLADAMWQLLDDMAATGSSVSGLAKAKARIAYEPFLDTRETFDDWMTLEQAQAIVRECDRA